MVRSTRIAAFAACALAFSAVPALAQDLALPGLDLDPFHIFTPAPAAAPTATAPVAHHHHHHHSHAHHGHHHGAKH